ncbi:MAG: site-2 protease family protein [Chlamydiales bacterium]|nr:site-2 protease family protein [Chlamydiales bacterium]
MIQSIFYAVLAAFGLGLLVFIHELGHYFVARRVGMTVEAFSIGFGKAIFSWEHKGVKWQVGWLPFGGYVRIKGMEKKGSQEPHQIPDGFFGKRPIDRIKVAVMGPVFNIIFAFAAFSAIWLTGGRDKPFAEFTSLIGWMDSCSAIYDKGVRPGDQITEYNNKPFTGFKDLLYASVTQEKSCEIKGNKIDYTSLQKEPFDYNLPTYPNPLSADPSFTTIGIFSPASFLVYDRQRNGDENTFQAGSPMYDSGIQYKDRIVWVDGELIFSLNQLSGLINEPKTLLTVQRGETTFLTRIPRLKVGDVKFTPAERAELDDWQHAGGFKTRVDQLFFIPYNLDPNAVVEREVVYLDENSKECRYQNAQRSAASAPLEVGDRILAVDGIAVATSADLFKEIQNRRVRVIVERMSENPSLSWKDADSYFIKHTDWQAVSEITGALGTAKAVSQAKNFYLLSPITPRPLSEFPLTSAQRSWLEQKESEQRKQIEAIENPKKKAEAMRQFENDQQRVKLGITLQDVFVSYNPSPFSIFGTILQDTWRTITGLFTGALNPKWMAGPVGIVEVIHHSWTIGAKEALFWMGLISLNLGLLNLLPIPVLDGGHICFSLVEMVTKKPIKAKTMEKLIIPFIVLLVALFVYLTYHDLIRVFSRFF